MKNFILVILIVFATINVAHSQNMFEGLFENDTSATNKYSEYQISLNEELNRYEYSEIFNFPGFTKSEIKKAIESSVKNPESITFNSEDRFVVNYIYPSGRFSRLFLTERFDFKDGKMKWTYLNIYYVKKWSKKSQPKPLRELNTGKRNSLIRVANKYLMTSRNAIANINIKGDSNW